MLRAVFDAAYEIALGNPGGFGQPGGAGGQRLFDGSNESAREESPLVMNKRRGEADLRRSGRKTSVMTYAPAKLVL